MKIRGGQVGREMGEKVEVYVPKILSENPPLGCDKEK